MSKVIKSPAATEAQPEVINEAFFEKYADAPLLLRAWEVVSDALEAIDEGVKILEEDDTHVGLISAYWVLKVLFRRATGADVKIASDTHWESVRRELLSGTDTTTTPCGKPSSHQEEITARNRAIVEFVMMDDADNPDRGTLQ